MAIKISREQLKVFETEMNFFLQALVRGGEDKFFTCHINMMLIRCDVPLLFSIICSLQWALSNTFVCFHAQ